MLYLAKGKKETKMTPCVGSACNNFLPRKLNILPMTLIKIPYHLKYSVYLYFTSSKNSNFCLCACQGRLTILTNNMQISVTLTQSLLLPRYSMLCMRHGWIRLLYWRKLSSWSSDATVYRTKQSRLCGRLFPQDPYWHTLHPFMFYWFEVFT